MLNNIRWVKRKFVDCRFIGYFLLRKFKLTHLWYLAANLTRRRIYLSCQGGVGDLIVAICYQDYLKEKGWYVSLIVQTPNPEVGHKLSGGRLGHGRFYSIGNSVEDVLSEILKIFSEETSIVYGDAWGNGTLYAHQRVLAILFGDAFICHSKSPFFKYRQNLDTCNLPFGVFLHARTWPLSVFLGVIEIVRMVKKLTMVDIRIVVTDLESTFPVPPDLVINNLSKKDNIYTPTLTLIQEMASCKFAITSRGGLSVMPILMGIPTINFWDQQGWEEWDEIWSGGLWDSNLCGKPISIHEFEKTKDFVLNSFVNAVLENLK